MLSLLSRRTPRRGWRKPRPLHLNQLEDRIAPAVVGYYDMSLGQGNANQVYPIQHAGQTPVLLTDLTAADLAGVDVLFVQNPDNDKYGAEFLSRLPDIIASVASGKTLILHDRFVDLAETILPGGGTFDIRRNFDDPNNINVLPPANSILIQGPGGTVTSGNLDGGGFSSHGYAIASSLPTGAKLLLSTGNPTNIVDFSYLYGNGYVLYSTIPLDYQLQFGGAFRDIYAVNAVAYGVDLLNLRPVVQDSTATLDEDGSVTGTRSATDGDRDPLTFRIVTGPTHGSVTILDAAAGRYRYSPDANFNGMDSFTFRADDGRDTSTIGTV